MITAPGHIIMFICSCCAASSFMRPPPLMMRSRAASIYLFATAGSLLRRRRRRNDQFTGREPVARACPLRGSSEPLARQPWVSRVARACRRSM